MIMKVLYPFDHITKLENVRSARVYSFTDHITPTHVPPGDENQPGGSRCGSSALLLSLRA